MRMLLFMVMVEGQPLCVTNSASSGSLGALLVRADWQRWSTWPNDERSDDFLFRTDELDHEFFWLVGRLDTSFQPL